MKYLACVCTILALTVTPLLAIPPPNAAFVWMQDPAMNMAAVDAVMEAATEGGGHIYHVMPIHSEPGRVLSGACLIGSIMPEQEAYILSLPFVRGVLRGYVDPMMMMPLGEEAVFAAGAWNYLFDEIEEPPPGAEPFPNDALTLPEPQGKSSDGIAGSTQNAWAGTYQTSEFMLRKVSIGVVLPESGAGGSENWSNSDPLYPGQNRQQLVYNKIVAGANWWATQGGTPANLTFYYDQRMGIATTYEPITVSSANNGEGAWVSNVLANMGYSALPAYMGAYSYVNALRVANNTDWGFAVFVADSLNDADDMFPNSTSAFAYLYGPYMVMTYDNGTTGGSWKLSRMNQVFAHEMGHTFGAPDEYQAPTCTCTAYGYLGVTNGNCVNCTATPVACIMKDNSLQMCTYTKGHVGWRDSDSDGKPDPIDTTPAFVYTSIFYANQPYWGQSKIRGVGTAQDNPYPSPTRTPVSINNVSALYSVDGGAWVNAVPDDGAFDSQSEAFGFWSATYPDGVHTVRMRALNSAGNTFDTTPATVVIDTTPPPAPAQAFIAEAPYVAPPVDTTITWIPGPPDPQSGVVAHHVGIGTTPTDPGYSQQLAQATVPISNPIQSYRFINLPPAHGQNYYAYVSQINGAGLGSPSVVSLPVRVDTTPPIPPNYVLDSGAWTQLPDRLSFSWPAGSEDISGIADYLLSIRDDQYNWLVTGQSTGGATSYTAMGLALNQDRKYFGHVVAKNGAKQLGTASPESDGIFETVPMASIGDVKRLGMVGKTFGLSGVIATSSGSDQTGTVYIEQPNRSSGIRTDSTDTISPNTIVDAAGFVSLNAQNELYLSSAEVAATGGTQTVGPLAMSGKALFGGPFYLQPGMTGGAGLNPTGLLVTAWGQVRNVSSGPPYSFVIDDGSGVFDPAGWAGIGVRCGSITPPTSGFVKVRGICSYDLGYPVILLRQTGDWW